MSCKPMVSTVLRNMKTVWNHIKLSLIQNGSCYTWTILYVCLKSGNACILQILESGSKLLKSLTLRSTSSYLVLRISLLVRAKSTSELLVLRIVLSNNLHMVGCSHKGIPVYTGPSATMSNCTAGLWSQDKVPTDNGFRTDICPLKINWLLYKTRAACRSWGWSSVLTDAVMGLPVTFETIKASEKDNTLRTVRRCILN